MSSPSQRSKRRPRGGPAPSRTLRASPSDRGAASLSLPPHLAEMSARMDLRIADAEAELQRIFQATPASDPAAVGEKESPRCDDRSSPITIPMHVRVEAAEPSALPPLSPTPPPPPPRARRSPRTPTSAHGGGSSVPSVASVVSSPVAAAAPGHMRRESRFLAHAALLDLQSEAAILAPRGSSDGRGGASSSAPFSLALAASLLHGVPIDSSNKTNAAQLSLPLALAAAPVSSGYSLLDGALARKKKLLADILAGVSGSDGDQRRRYPMALPPVADDDATADDDGAGGASEVDTDVLTSRAAVARQLQQHSHQRNLTGFDSSNSWMEAAIMAAGPALSPLQADTAMLLEDADSGAPLYSYLVEDAATLAGEHAQVARLLRFHQRNMAASVPLDVQLQLGRLHYHQYEGNQRPNLLEHHRAEQLRCAQEVDKQLQERLAAAEGSQSSRTASKTSLHAHLQQPSGSLSARPSQRSLHSNGSTSTLHSLSSSRPRKITFLTQSASDSSLSLADTLASSASRGSGLANHVAAVMASVNDPLRIKQKVVFDYADRFGNAEMDAINAELDGARGNESIAYAVPRSNTIAAGRPTARGYRSTRTAGPLVQSLAKLAAINRGTPGPGAHHVPSSAFARAASSVSASGGAADPMGLGRNRLAGAHVADATLALKQGTVGTPGPGSYEAALSDPRSVGTGVHARAVGLLSDPHEYFDEKAGPGDAPDAVAAAARKCARRKLEVDLARFDARMAQAHSASLRTDPPGPGSYHPRPVQPKGTGASVTYRAPNVPPLPVEPPPGAGAYDLAGTVSRSRTSAAAGAHLSVRASLAAAGAAANFVGFGSSASRAVTVTRLGAGSQAVQSSSASSRGTRAERLIDFHPMPRLTARDRALIAADEAWNRNLAPGQGGGTGGTSGAGIDADSGGMDGDLLSSSAAAASSSASLLAPGPLSSPRSSRFGALLYEDRVAARPRSLVTMRPPHIVPALLMPREVAASHDESVKTEWLRQRARSNNERQRRALERHAALQAVRRERLLVLQSREAKIAARDALRVTQQRWLVLLVHGALFHRYKERHAADNRRARLLRAALVLQYYWRLRTARLMGSSRYQALFTRLRRSFLKMVIQFRVRQKKRALGLLARFLSDHLATAGSGRRGERKLLNIVQRFKHSVRVIQRFVRRCLLSMRAQVEFGCAQLARTEARENASLLAHAAAHPGAQGLARSVREYALNTLKAARERIEQDKATGVPTPYAYIAPAPSAPVQQVTRKGAVPRQGQGQGQGAEAESKEALHHHRGAGAGAGPEKRRSVFFSEQVHAGMIVRAGPGGKATVMPIFQPLQHLQAHEGKPATHTIAELHLQLGDAVRRTVVAAACSIRRRRHRADVLRQAEAEERYLSRNGSALHSGIELARLLLTGESAKIAADRAAFGRKYPQPFPRALMPEHEARALLLDAYFLQGHLDEERALVSRAAVQGASRAAIASLRGCLTLSLRQVLLRAPAGTHQPGAVDQVRLGTPLAAVHPGHQAGVALALLNVGPRTADAHHQGGQGQGSGQGQVQAQGPAAVAAAASRTLANSIAIGGVDAVRASFPQHVEELFAAQDAARLAHAHSSHGQGRDGHGHGHGHTSSWHVHQPRVDEYSYKSFNVLPTGLLAFHATLAAAVRFAEEYARADGAARGGEGAFPGVDTHSEGLGPAAAAASPGSTVSLSASGVLSASLPPGTPLPLLASSGPSDPFFHQRSKSTGLFPSVAAHVSRSGALRESEARRLAERLERQRVLKEKSAIMRSPFADAHLAQEERPPDHSHAHGSSSVPTAAARTSSTVSLASSLDAEGAEGAGEEAAAAGDGRHSATPPTMRMKSRIDAYTGEDGASASAAAAPAAEAPRSEGASTAMIAAALSAALQRSAPINYTLLLAHQNKKERHRAAAGAEAQQQQQQQQQAASNAADSGASIGSTLLPIRPSGTATARSPRAKAMPQAAAASKRA